MTNTSKDISPESFYPLITCGRASNKTMLSLPPVGNHFFTNQDVPHTMIDANTRWPQASIVLDSILEKAQDYLYLLNYLYCTLKTLFF